MNNIINKGDIFKCIADVVTPRGTVFYEKGKVYKSENDRCITDENGNKQHWWDECFKINFVKIDQEGINVYIIGVPERGEELINMLEERGGVNRHAYDGTASGCAYVISPKTMAIEYFSEQEVPVVMHGRTELKLPEPDYLDTLQDGESVMCSDNAGCMSWCLRLFNKETRGATNADTGKVVKWDNIVAVRDFDFVNLCKREL